MRRVGGDWDGNINQGRGPRGSTVSVPAVGPSDRSGRNVTAFAVQPQEWELWHAARSVEHGGHGALGPMAPCRFTARQPGLPLPMGPGVGEQE